MYNALGIDDVLWDEIKAQFGHINLNDPMPKAVDPTFVKRVVFQETDIEILMAYAETWDPINVLFLVNDEVQSFYYDPDHDDRHNPEFIKEMGVICGFLFNARQSLLTVFLADFTMFKNEVFGDK